MRLAFLLCVSATTVFAGAAEREQLALRIEALGAHETAKERHAVEIDQCRMTTYVWKDWDEHGKVLWSSWDFDLAGLAPPEGPDPSIAITSLAGGTISIFTMLPETSARQEMAMRRNPKPPYEPSPRQDVDSFV